MPFKTFKWRCQEGEALKRMVGSALKRTLQPREWTRFLKRKYREWERQLGQTLRWFKWMVEENACVKRSMVDRMNKIIKLAEQERGKWLSKDRRESPNCNQKQKIWDGLNSDPLTKKIRIIFFLSTSSLLFPLSFWGGRGVMWWRGTILVPSVSCVRC